MLPALALFAARLAGGPKRRDLPYMIAALGLAFAYVAGVMKAGPLSATHALMNWLLPVAFGHFIACRHRSYPDAAAGMKRLAVLAGLLLGVYGIWQFLDPPPWDAYWMSQVPMTNIGSPAPYQVRVFSTLNSPGTFGLGIMAILTVLLTVKLPWRLLAMGPALTALLLSLVRSAWGGWLLACLMFLGLARGRARGAILVLIPGVALLALAILSSGPVAETISGRFATVGDISADQSFQDRVEFHLNFAAQAFGNPLGHGLGATGLSAKLGDAASVPGALADFDSGVMNIAFELGWLGSAAYVTGVAMLFVRALRTAPREDEFAVASLAIASSILAQLIFVNTLNGFGGLLFFTFVSLAAAAGERRTGGAA
jgi:hypothetical protein